MCPYKFTEFVNLKESDLIFKNTEARDRLNIKERFFYGIYSLIRRNKKQKKKKFKNHILWPK